MRFAAMTRIVLRSCLAATIAATGVLYGAPTSADESLVGQRVITIEFDVPFKEGSTVVYTATLGEVFTVEQVQGEWLWVVGRGGWVKRSDVAPYDQAIDYCSQLIAREPSSYNYYVRAIIREARGEYGDAIADYTQAIRLDPSDPENYSARAVAFDYNGQFDESIADATMAIRLGADYPEVYGNRASAYYSKGEYDRAIADYTQALRLDSDNRYAYIGRGLCRSAKGEYDRAIADYNEALRIDPRDAIAYNNRANSWYNKGELQRALDDYNRAIQFGPEDADPYNGRANVWVDMGLYDEAIAAYGEAIRLDPHFAYAFGGRGNAWAAKGQYQQALDDYYEALRLDPQYVQAFSRAAWLLSACPDEGLRDAAEAVALATRACELAAWIDADALDSLAAAYAESGDFAKAVEFAQRAVALAPDVAEYAARLILYQSGKPYRIELPAVTPQ
jgi:tetratricopeptide (TPR) repeat protein